MYTSCLKPTTNTLELSLNKLSTGDYFWFYPLAIFLREGDLLGRCPHMHNILNSIFSFESHVFSMSALK